jgi:hypothetical protein
MRPLKLWIPLCCSLLLIFILLQAPATLLALGLQQQRPDFTISAVSGSVWSGYAYGLGGQWHDQQLALDTLHWRLRPLSLLSLSPTVELRAELGSQRYSGRVSWLPGDRLRLRQVQASLPARMLSSSSAPLPLAGQIRVELESLAIDAGRITGAEGRVVLQDVSLTGSDAGLPLGSFAAELSHSAQGELVATLFDLGGVLQLDSQISMNLQGYYHMQAEVAVRQGGDERLRQWLPLVGEDMGNHRYRLSPRGQLW